jgi:hypothetical protein
MEPCEMAQRIEALADYSHLWTSMGGCVFGWLLEDGADGSG